jgi:hypothetical protein
MGLDMLVTRSTAKQVHLDCTLLKSHIRFGHKPDAHYLFEEWMRMEEALTISQPSAKRRCFERQCRVLIDAVCDELVPQQWRCACLDQINKPLQRLKALTSTPEQQQNYIGLTREIRICSHYVQQTMQTQSNESNCVIEKTLGMIARKTNQSR